MRNRRYLYILSVIILVTAACNLPQRISIGTSAPTETIPAATITPLVTLTPAPATATLQSPTHTATLPPITGGCTDSAALVADVTIPDGTQFAPNTGFNKTWRIKNTGTCIWDARYKMVHAGGNVMNALSTAYPLPGIVSPGQSIDLTVGLVSPSTPGTHQGDWKLQNPQAQPFGVGRNNSPFWVQIIVVNNQTTTISGIVYQDVNQNGVFDNGEPRMGNRTVQLIAGSACHVRNTATALALSGADGRYTISGDYRGDFCVGLVGEQGLDDVIGVTLSAGQQLNTINLKSALVNASISGWVWSDYCLTDENGAALDGDCVADGNGVYHADGMIQPTERNIAGVTVFLQSGACANNNNVIVSAKTNAAGQYAFNNLSPGVYCISMNASTPENAPLLLPGDWTYPQLHIWYQEISLQAGDQAYSVNFGWDYQLK